MILPELGTITLLITGMDNPTGSSSDPQICQSLHAVWSFDWLPIVNQTVTLETGVELMKVYTQMQDNHDYIMFIVNSAWINKYSETSYILELCDQI